MRRFHVAPMGGLFVSLVLRVCLTLLATNILVPGTVPFPSIPLVSLPQRLCGASALSAHRPPVLSLLRVL